MAGKRWEFHEVKLADGSGYRVLIWHCPGCNLGHQVPISGPQAWQLQLDGQGRPTLSPSVLIHGFHGGPPYPSRPRCHGFLVAGSYQFCGDSEHALAGSTVELPEIPE